VFIACEITTSRPIVVATATPKINGPQNSATAVIVKANRGENAREEIIVATILQESVMPFRKVLARANTIMTIVMDDIMDYLY
jgi:small neutral amino acid transporter SnatA (MarC family)